MLLVVVGFESVVVISVTSIFGFAIAFVAGVVIVVVAGVVVKWVNKKLFTEGMKYNKYCEKFNFELIDD